MDNSPDINVRAEKRDSITWSKMRWFSFQKIDLHFVIDIQVQIGLFLEILETGTVYRS